MRVNSETKAKDWKYVYYSKRLSGRTLTADVMIVMKPFKEWTSASSRAEMVEKMKQALESVEGAEFNFSQPIQLRFNELMTGAKADIAIKLYGEDMEELYL